MLMHRCGIHWNNSARNCSSSKKKQKHQQELSTTLSLLEAGAISRSIQTENMRSTASMLCLPLLIFFPFPSVAWRYCCFWRFHIDAGQKTTSIISNAYLTLSIIIISIITIISVNFRIYLRCSFSSSPLFTLFVIFFFFWFLSQRTWLDCCASEKVGKRAGDGVC